jgi:hypothetical protein
MTTNRIWLTVLMGSLLLPLSPKHAALAFEVTDDDSWNEGGGDEGGGDEGGGDEGGGDERLLAKGFSGCSADQEAAISYASLKAQLMLEDLAPDLEQATIRPSDAMVARLKKHFKVIGAMQVREVAATLKYGYADLVNATKAGVPVQCNQDDCGDHARLISPAVEFCAEFFKDSPTGQANTWIHELSHRNLKTDDLHGKATDAATALRDAYAWADFVTKG